MRRRVWLVGALAAPWLGPAHAPARAQKAEDTLRVVWRDAITDLDPYRNALRTGLVVAHHAWDTLVHRDPETLQLKPLLATAWRNVDPVTLEFDLRPGVRFHDGAPFTADDVVYTVDAILTEPEVAVPSLFAALDGAERVDESKVRIRLKRAFPAALEILAMAVPILPKAYRERVGAGFSRAPVGTGPYRVASVDEAGFVLERNEAYFDGPKGQPAIRRVAVRQVADSAAELAAISSGEADWIWRYGLDQVEALNRVPGVQTLRAEGMRVAFMTLDAAGRTGTGGPMTHLKVRQAILHAVDRQALARQHMSGARVLDAPCHPTQFGCDQAIAAKYEYDPAKARALLAEAGYPHGFETELIGALLPQVLDAVQGHLGAVGIQARVVRMQAQAATRRAARGRVPLGLTTWSSYSVNDVSAFLPRFFGGGEQDYARDPEVRRLVLEGGEVADPDQRRRAYSAAIRRITEQAYVMPLFTVATTYAVSRQVAFKPSSDELPRFYLASWR